MRLDRQSPDLRALFAILAEHGVAYVVTGSTAALLLGVDLAPGDLDIVPALDAGNLARLAGALRALDARPDPAAPFGGWQQGPDGERHWVSREPAPGEMEARRRWRPDAARPTSFDHLLVTRCGALDVVPEVSGIYDDLASRAITVEAFGLALQVASPADQLATLTVARRQKDHGRVHALRALQRR